MKRLWYNIAMFFVNLRSKKLNPTVKKYLTYGGLGLALVLIGFFAYSRVSVYHSQQAREQQAKVNAKRIEREQKANAGKTWAKTKVKVDKHLYDNYANNPNFDTTKGYAELLVNVIDDNSRRDALNGIPWQDKNSASTLSDSDYDNYPTYNKLKTHELLYSGKTYGETYETYVFLFSTTYYNDDDDKWQNTESVTIQYNEEGKVKYWNVDKSQGYQGEKIKDRS